MNDILDFLIAHWQLTGTLLLLIVAYMIFEFMQSQSSDSISPEQAVELINHKHAVVVDVRSSEEFNAGHILHAIHFEHTEPDAKFTKLNKYTQKPVIVVCARGRRAANFLKRLRAKGFENAVCLAGGLEAWQNAGMPLTNSDKK